MSEINKELDSYYDKAILQKIASFGLRGEIFLPIPSLIMKNHLLIGYYRLLYGLSQKEFYTKGDFAKYRFMEDPESRKHADLKTVTKLIEKIGKIGEELVSGIDSLSIDIVNELQLLTLGPQLRGSRNTELGKRATERTFEIIKNFVSEYIIKSDSHSITLLNRLNQNVLIQFASDPDIVIIESLHSEQHKLVSIEIKGGTDYSNAHNRLGEAEKSHQKAKQNGFYEFWTIVRVDIDPLMARKESPTTTRFFNLDKIEDANNPEAIAFKEQLASRIKILQ